VFATTGDGARNPPASHQPGGVTDSNAVLRATGLAVVDRSVNNYYFPSRWQDMDINDNDFGSNNPIFIQVPGATQKGLVVALSKDGHMVFLDSQKLGGMDGHVLDLMVARKGMSIHTAPASYRTAKGVYVTLGTDGGASCPGLGGQVIMGVSIPVTAGAIKPVVAWCVPQTGAVTSPIATTTDGTGEAIVWFMSGGKLMGVDGDSGKTVAAPTGTCAGVLRWTSPIAVKGRIVTGGGTKLCSWSVP
jgi:hypothetical protein